jgi:hypothetical protein
MIGMCEFCDIRVGEKKYIRDNDYTSLVIERDRHFYYIVAKGDDEAIHILRYCFLCGRRLDGGDE